MKQTFWHPPGDGNTIPKRARFQTSSGTSDFDPEQPKRKVSEAVRGVRMVFFEPDVAPNNSNTVGGGPNTRRPRVEKGTPLHFPRFLENPGRRRLHCCRQFRSEVGSSRDSIDLRRGTRNIFAKPLIQPHRLLMHSRSFSSSPRDTRRFPVHSGRGVLFQFIPHIHHHRF